MPKVTLEFICSVGVGIIPINGVSRPLDAVLTPVLSMLDMLTVERMMRVHGIRIGQGHLLVLLLFVFCKSEPYHPTQTMFLPQKPLHGNFGMIDDHSRTVQGFHSNGIGHHTVHAQVSILLQANAMVIWSKRLKFANRSKSRLKLRHPCLSNLTSDSQYLISSFAKSNTTPSTTCWSYHLSNSPAPLTHIPLGM